GLLVLGDGLDLDGDAVLLTEPFGEGLEGGGPLVVGPDHQLAAVGLGGVGAGRLAIPVATAGGGQGEGERGGHARGTDTHRISCRYPAGGGTAAEGRGGMSMCRRLGRAAIAGTLARPCKYWKSFQSDKQNLSGELKFCHARTTL